MTGHCDITTKWNLWNVLVFGKIAYPGDRVFWRSRFQRVFCVAVIFQAAACARALTLHGRTREVDKW